MTDREGRGGRRGRQLTGLLSAALSAGAIVLSCGGQSQNDPGKATVVMSDGGTPGASGAPGGVSANPDECVPYDDTCPVDSYCQYLDGRTQCVAEGDIARDELCNDGARCQRGSICMHGSDLYGDSCQQPCLLDDPDPCFIRRHTCFVALGDEGEQLSFGVCRYSR